MWTSEIFLYVVAFAAVVAIVVAVVSVMRDVDSAGAAGWLGPRWIALYRAKRRRAAFEAKILDLTMGLANAMKAGMAFPEALERIGAQVGGVMHEEIDTTMREYRLGKGIEEAFARLQDRMPGEDMRLLVCAVRLSKQTGGSLVEVLKEMVETIRKRTEFQQKLRSLVAQGKFEAIAMAAAPLAAFLLLYFTQPGLMMPLITTVKGWIAIGVALTLETIGYLIIRKIITIEV